MEKVAANYSVFLGELRALALAVLAVQVCAAESGVTCNFCSDRSLRCRGLQCPKASTGVVASKSRDVNLQLAACKTLASKLGTRMQPFEYRSVRYWSKEINGTRTGGQK